MAESVEINDKDLTLTGELKIEVIAVSNDRVKLQAKLIDSQSRKELYLFETVECGPGFSMSVAGIEVKMTGKLM